MVRIRADNIVRLPKYAVTAAQEVHITCWGDPLFNDVQTSVNEIRHLFEEHSKPSSLRAFEEPHFMNHSVFSASNRYFTRKKVAPHCVLTQYDKNIDPDDILHEYAMGSKTTLVNTEENMVMYYERVVEEKGAPL